MNVLDAIAWRVRKLVGDQIVDNAIVKFAHCWRPLLKKPAFIGITGSAGKTTTKELLVGILSYTYKGIGNLNSLNVLPEVAKTVLSTRLTHDFCVAELSEDRPGIMDEHLRLLHPSIGIVTVVGNDHWSAYNSREAIAAEMGKLIEALPSSGTAVLNADDALVHGMAANCAANVITYGTSAKADLRAEDVRSVWPERLSMTLVHGAERVAICTQLCGTHWLPSVLGAIGGGLAMGMTLEQCAAGIASVAPFEGRMQPVTTPDGVTFIRDDFKAPLWTLDACFDFMRRAHAKRKIIVIGTLSECGANSGKKYAQVASRAQEIADHTIFVGPRATHALKAGTLGTGDSLRAFNHVRDASQYVNSLTREGDLVMLKGSSKQDHLLRVFLARGEGAVCWRDDCKRTMFCNECSDLMKPSGAPLLRHQGNTETAPIDLSSGVLTGNTTEQVIIGLGNPEPQYAGTPHNIGYQVVDHLAASLELTWISMSEAWIAHGESGGQSICLVKI